MKDWFAWKLISMGLYLMGGKLVVTDMLKEDGDDSDSLTERVIGAWGDILDDDEQPPCAAVIVGVWPHGCAMRVEFEGDNPDDWFHVRQAASETLRFVRKEEREERFLKSEQVH